MYYSSFYFLSHKGNFKTATKVELPIVNPDNLDIVRKRAKKWIVNYQLCECYIYDENKRFIEQLIIHEDNIQTAVFKYIDLLKAKVTTGKDYCKIIRSNYDCETNLINKIYVGLIERFVDKVSCRAHSWTIFYTQNNNR